MTAVDRLEQAEQRIEWVLSHPGTSDWLKACLRTLRLHHPVQALNDLEVLDMLVRERSIALIDGLLAPAAQTDGPPSSRPVRWAR
ncbi:hypothetical protein [Frateuria soli]|uniref:hypothetical protein n=1 Tax=Frateuria soli TaxID=1542730 RepID=UPI001E56CCD3|nr:hypothetical protein [Frateuria soli]UGB39542.1 hypothetical protein LQ771_06865 [Frateuria soli]